MKRQRSLYGPEAVVFVALVQAKKQDNFFSAELIQQAAMRGGNFGCFLSQIFQDRS